MLDFTYPKILELFSKYSAPKRNESASFLIWYLVNFYRLDDLEAVDSVCDQRGDKGVDGIYVNEGDGTIDIFQSKIYQNAAATVGDVALKEFHGTLAQFHSKKTLENMVQAAGDAEITRLMRHLNLIDLIGNYDVRGIFLANAKIDNNGLSYLKASPSVVFRGPVELTDTYVSDKRPLVKPEIAEFDVSGFSATSYAVDINSKAVIAPVSAKELVKLHGLADQSLFSLNVRASLGSTQVNRDIVSSIKDPALHKLFPLFHNGITVIAGTVSHDQNKIRIEDYFVVNGCQSLNAMFQQKSNLTDDLRVLTKFIQVPRNSDLSETITAFSNNQNGVKSRDFKSNHPIQTRLQNEFKQHFEKQFCLEVKRGEPLGEGEKITNEDAGLCLIAFDLKEPWTTHRKYQIFDERYSDIFGRPNVTADRIVFCHLLAKEIEQRLEVLDNRILAKYVLTKFAILYTLRKILESEDLGTRIIENPKDFVRPTKERARLQLFLGSLLDCLLIDLNLETRELPDDFDYRGKLRDKEYVEDLTKNLLGSYLKDVKRKKEPTQVDRWANALPLH